MKLFFASYDKMRKPNLYGGINFGRLYLSFSLLQSSPVVCHDGLVFSLKIFVLSFQHLDIAALLIKYNTSVNAVDRWGFTPLHEASQKGRTQLCALLVCYLKYSVIREKNSRQFFYLILLKPQCSICH